ncbi:MAG: hypothetical protein LBL07_03665 [Tannerella sp.]|jgi:hypothetical protein|nr:hypothetical protein [Tannerella sp.]
MKTYLRIYVVTFICAALGYFCGQDAGGEWATRGSAVDPAMLPEKQDTGRGSGRDAMHRVSTKKNRARPAKP